MEKRETTVPKTVSAQTAMIEYFAAFSGRKNGCLAGEQGAVWWSGSTSAILTDGASVAASFGVEVIDASPSGWKGTLRIEGTGRGAGSARVEYEAKRSVDDDGDIVLVTYKRFLR